jgi:dsDNA-specific endonuclease/ATPase MutS2
MSLFKEIYIRRLRFDEAKHKLLSDLEHLFFQGVTDVEIVHGIGNYVLRNMAIEELKKLDYVAFDDISFNPNPGSLKIRLLTPDQGLLETYRG